ncbi:uroporphyrinogen-III C-methyltransferase [Methylacidiphilum caldifontis]|uniref:uroporphyrinogen-III C-methyltransferase n=1 Tax=Methylacidiphilum caldifontis TaxID=2795386 RepID=A0A4Y8PCY0_9BACT|nr:uroporphyrinogen-III C-methyltransferase [Methylacidiphilum caldifontis]TFE68959.1 uroporphyrinogen-III C-methyltransferase [Methylacidiphilum caldifontis]
MNGKDYGVVYLVGAGPGDPSLLTLRAKELIEKADVIFYDYLCNPKILDWSSSHCMKVYVGKIASKATYSQREIEEMLIAKAKEGKTVVRLKGGDPFLFGRGGEEAEALKKAGIPFEIVPGVSSALAVPAYAGIPLTHRNWASQLTIVTGHEDPLKESSALSWETIAKSKGTIVVLMGVERLAIIAKILLKQGMDPLTPMAIVSWGTLPYQKVITLKLADIGAGSHPSIDPPAVLIIGEVVRLREDLKWFEKRPLYGQKIVVTRTKEGSAKLAGKLANLGAEVLEIPTIRIVPQCLDENQIRLLKNIGSFYDWILFTSPTGVELFFKEFLKLTGDIRQLKGVKIGAIGTSTARAISLYNLPVEVIPEKFTSVDLARCFSLKRIKGLRFLLPRSALADEGILEFLTSLGASVDQWSLYDIQPETEDVRGDREKFKQTGAHWILFASASSVKYWYRLNLSCHDTSLLPKIISIGPQTTRALKELNQEVYIESKVHTIDGLVETLLEELRGNKQKD